MGLFLYLNEHPIPNRKKMHIKASSQKDEAYHFLMRTHPSSSLILHIERKPRPCWVIHSISGSKPPAQTKITGSFPKCMAWNLPKRHNDHLLKTQRLGEGSFLFLNVAFPYRIKHCSFFKGKRRGFSSEGIALSSHTYLGTPKVFLKCVVPPPETVLIISLQIEGVAGSGLHSPPLSVPTHALICLLKWCWLAQDN